jgi:hypothetical protein
MSLLCRLRCEVTFLELVGGTRAGLPATAASSLRWVALCALICCLSPAVSPSVASASEHRSRAVAREFQREHPCPSTGRTTGACPGYWKDHIVPLGCGGRDAVANLQWQTIADARAKDQWERRLSVVDKQESGPRRVSHLPGTLKDLRVVARDIIFSAKAARAGAPRCAAAQPEGLSALIVRIKSCARLRKVPWNGRSSLKISP